MTAPDEERTGILVLRAWVEADGQLRLRVRITRTIQGASSEPIISATATIDGACRAVRTWLEELLHGPERLSPPNPR